MLTIFIPNKHIYFSFIHFLNFLCTINRKFLLLTRSIEMQLTIVLRNCSFDHSFKQWFWLCHMQCHILGSGRYFAAEVLPQDWMSRVRNYMKCQSTLTSFFSKKQKVEVEEERQEERPPQNPWIARRVRRRNFSSPSKIWNHYTKKAPLRHRQKLPSEIARESCLDWQQLLLTSKKSK